MENGYAEYNIIELEGDDGEVYEFAVTDMFEFEDRNFAVLELIEGEELTGAYMIYEAIINDETKEISLEELDEEEEEYLTTLYDQQLSDSADEFIED